jgi:hypothetical protein
MRGRVSGLITDEELPQPLTQEHDGFDVQVFGNGLVKEKLDSGLKGLILLLVPEKEQ